MQKSGPSASKPLSALLLFVSHLVLVEDRREFACRSSSKRQLHKPWRPCVHKSCSDVLRVFQDERHRHTKATSEQACISGACEAQVSVPHSCPVFHCPSPGCIPEAKMRPMARFSMLDGKLYPAAVFLGVDSLKLQSLDFWGSLRSA